MNISKSLSLVLMSFFVFSACAAGAKDVVLGQEESGKVLTVNVGDKVKILLPSNPTTGYGWEFFIENGKDNVEVVKDDFIPPEYNGLVGTAGDHIYEFHTVSVGETNIAGYYYRPWEGLNKAKDTGVKYKIIIK